MIRVLFCPCDIRLALPYNISNISNIGLLLLYYFYRIGQYRPLLHTPYMRLVPYLPYMAVRHKYRVRGLARSCGCDASELRLAQFLAVFLNCTGLSLCHTLREAP
jgi:hypothetical protein